MTSDSFIEVCRRQWTGLAWDQGPRNGPHQAAERQRTGLRVKGLQDYLGMVGIRHILAAPFHPQTNGKLERYHQTLKRDVNQLPYELPSDLEAAIVAFVSYYNYRRYHKALGNVTPSDVLRGRRQEILQRRNEIQAQTIERRRQPQQGPQGAHETFIQPVISRVSKCSTFAACQHPSTILYGRQNCLRDVVGDSVRPLGPPPHDYDNTGRASTRRLRPRRSIRQRSLLFLPLRHPVADAGLGEDVGAVALVAAEAADGGAHGASTLNPTCPTSLAAP